MPPKRRTPGRRAKPKINDQQQPTGRQPAVRRQPVEQQSTEQQQQMEQQPIGQHQPIEVDQPPSLQQLELDPLDGESVIANDELDAAAAQLLDDDGNAVARLATEPMEEEEDSPEDSENEEEEDSENEEDTPAHPEKEDVEMEEEKTPVGSENEGENETDSRVHQSNEENEDESSGEPSGKVESGIYMAVQKQPNGMVMYSVKKPPKGFPAFVLVDNPCLNLGDRVEINKVELVERPGKWQWMAPDKKINYSAVATEIGHIMPLPTEEVVGVITEVNRQKGRDDAEFKNMVVSSVHLVGPQKMYAHNFGKDFEESDCIPGSIILLDIVTITQPAEVRVGPFSTYILPNEAPFYGPQDSRVHQPVLAVKVKKNYRQFIFPFGPERPLREVEFGEKVIGAAISACVNKCQMEAEQAKIITCLTVLQDFEDRMFVCFEHFVESKAKLVLLDEAFEEDAPVVIKANSRIAKPCANGYVIEKCKDKRDNGYLFQAKLKIIHQEARKYPSFQDFRCIAERSKFEVEIKPQQSIKMMKERALKFENNEFSSAEEGSIIRTLMGRGIVAQKPAIEFKELVHVHGALKFLHAGQRESAQYMFDNLKRLVYQQAPPGTGKTWTACRIAAALLKRFPGRRILFLAPLNVALVRATKEMEKALKEEKLDEKILALFSGHGKEKYKKELDDIWEHLLAVAISAQEVADELTDKEKKEVDRYKLACDKRPKTADEGKMAKLLFDIVPSEKSQRIIFATLGLTELIGAVFGEFDYIIVDECGQASYSQLLSVLSIFPGIKKLFLTGDRHQLPVYLKSFPEPVQKGFGLETCILNLDTPGVNKTLLSINFRSHPHIVKCVSAATYEPAGEPLQTGPGDFRRLIDFPELKTPQFGSPLVLIHQESPTEPEITTYSSTNSGQSRTCQKLLDGLRHFEGTIRVIAFYSAQVRELAMCAPMNASTADACQGHEADLCIIVTTVSDNAFSLKDKKEKFWNDGPRVNVALSRARHGLIIIGNLKVLFQSGGVWKRFLQAATRFTVVVDSRFYCPAAVDQDSRFIRGILHHRNESARNDKLQAMIEEREVGGFANAGFGKFRGGFNRGRVQQKGWSLKFQNICAISSSSKAVLISGSVQPV